MAKKKTSESDSNSNRAGTSPAAKSPARRRPAATSGTRAKASSSSPEIQDLAADMSVPANASQPHAHDEIAQAAYHRYLRRGGHHGRDVEDWFEAEQEIRTRQSR